MTPAARALLLWAALAARLVPILIADRTVADVLRYQKVGSHVLDVSWNPYQAPRLYPYPPVWVWVEAGSLWLSRRTGLSFPILIKLPALAADLLIVAWLAARAASGKADARGAWLYALHPVSVLVSGFHGQFEALALLFVLLALQLHERGRFDRSALALAAAIALKGLPVLLLPVFLLQRERPPWARFTLLALGPVLALLAPYAAHDPGALSRELFGYGGVADFGWIGLWRGLDWLNRGVLARGEAAHWGGMVTAAKLVFLALYALLLVALARRRFVWSLAEACLAVFLAFLAFYGAVSAQYLLWVVPLGVLFPDRFLAAYTAAATLALLGFYPFLAPGVLFAAEPAWLTRQTVGALWVSGVGAVLAACVAWLFALVRRGRR